MGEGRRKVSARPGTSLATRFSISEFTDCWTDFVNPQRPFQPWNQLEKNSRCIQRRLRRIKEVRSALLHAPPPSVDPALLLQAPPAGTASRFRLHPLLLLGFLQAPPPLPLGWALEPPYCPPSPLFSPTRASWSCLLSLRHSPHLSAPVLSLNIPIFKISSLPRAHWHTLISLSTVLGPARFVE